DKSAIGLTGAGKVSLGQLVTASVNSNGVVTFTATDAKLPSTHSFALQDSAATTQKLAVEVLDANNTGIAARLGIGGGSGEAGLDVLGAEPANTPVGLSYTMTPVAKADFTQAFAFDLVIDTHPITVSLAADPTRTDVNAMANAIKLALSKLSVDRASFGLACSGTTTLDHVVSVSATGTQITLSGTTTSLAPSAGGTASLTVRDIAVSAGSDTEAAGTNRVVTGKALDTDQ